MADEGELQKLGAVVGGGQVAVVGPDGRAGTVSSADVEQFLAANPGWGLESPGAYQERIDKETYGDQTGRAALEGFARGATLGLSDVAARELGADTEAMAKRKKYNPITSTVSEIGGAVAPGLLTMGASTPAGLTARVGAGVAEAAGGGLRGAVAGGVAEGALFGAGAGVSNVALSQDPITAEALLHEVGSNALYGAAVGGVGAGVIHGAAKGGSAILDKLSTKAAEFSEKMASKAAPEEASIFERIATPPDTQAARAAVKEASAEAATLRKEVQAEETAARKASKATTKEAEKHIEDATTRLRKQVEDLDSFAARNLKQAEKHPLYTTENSELRAATEEVSALRENVQSRLGLKRETAGRGPKRSIWGLKPEDTVAMALENRAALESLASAQNRLQRLLGNKDYGIAPLSALDDFAKVPRFEPPASLLEKQKRLAEIESVIQRHRSGAVQAEAAQETIDLGMKAGITEPTPAELAQYHKGMAAPVPGSAADRIARAQYYRDQAAKILSKTGEGSGQGLFSRLAGKVSRKAGDVAGAAVGGYMGGTTGAIIGREVGSMAGDILRGVFEGKAEMAAAAGRYAKKISDGIQRFLKASKGASAKASSATARGLAALQFHPQKSEEKDGWKARMDEVSRYTANPMAVRQQVNQNLKPIRNWDAFIADRMETSAVARLDYLASKAMPKRPYPKPLGAKDRWEPTDAEKARLARVAQIADDPLAVFDLLEAGRLTPEHVQTLKDLSPETFMAIQRGIYAHLPELKEDLPYEKRLMLGLLFGVAVDPSLQPNVVMGIQNRYKSEPSTDGGEHPPMADKISIGSVKKSGETQTKAQRLRGAESER